MRKTRIASFLPCACPHADRYYSRSNGIVFVYSPAIRKNRELEEREEKIENY